MKTFIYELGHEAGKTLTVGELKALLSNYNDDLPVLAEWEVIHAYINPELFSVQTVGRKENECDCLIINVDQY